MINYNYRTEPTKSGKYRVIYRRSKSKEYTFGTAYFGTKRSKTITGWSQITNRHTGKPVGHSFDSRDSRLYSPTVVAWSPL